MVRMIVAIIQMKKTVNIILKQPVNRKSLNVIQHPLAYLNNGAVTWTEIVLIGLMNYTVIKQSAMNGSLDAAMVIAYIRPGNAMVNPIVLINLTRKIVQIMLWNHQGDRMCLSQRSLMVPATNGCSAAQITNVFQIGGNATESMTVAIIQMNTDVQIQLLFLQHRFQEL